MSINSSNKNIYPSTFFSLPTPATAWFSVQFRNKVIENTNIETANIWEELSVRQNTFVKSITIEDTGGAKKLTLVLFDQYFNYIENLVMGSIFLTRASNELYKKDLNNINKDDLNLQFALSKENLSNLRVRIGYSDINSSETFFESISSGTSFENRINKEQTVIRSPWMYFMINGITNEITDDGLQMTISGLSLSFNTLNNLKLIQQFSKITGTPEDIINNLRELLGKVPSTNLKILPFGQGSEKPEMLQNEKIEIFLGGEPKKDKNNNLITSYKTVGEIFNDICSKVSPKNIDNTIFNEEDKQEAIESENFSNYSYFVTIDESGNENISFYYPDPKNSAQTTVRIYDWRETPNTIVKSVNIQTATDFAIMSQKLVVNSPFSEKREIGFLPQKTETINGYETFTPNISANKVVEYYDLAGTESFSFISDVIDAKQSNSKETERTYLNQLKNEFLKNINRQVFKGTITIPGDPFYFFDTKIRPFEYFIKLNVMRPGKDGIAVKSYLTGNYVITSINHVVDESGFFTTLGVMRYPLKEEVTQITDETEVYKILGLEF